MLNGPHAALPSRTFFQPVLMALQEHTRRLADSIVQTTAANVAGTLRVPSAREASCVFMLRHTESAFYNDRSPLPRADGVHEGFGVMQLTASGPVPVVATFGD